MQNKENIQDIFQRLRSGERKRAAEELYQVHYNKIYGIAYSIVKSKEGSEDVVQNVVYKLLTVEERLLPTTGERAWLYRVVKQESLALLRKEKNVVSAGGAGRGCLHRSTNRKLRRHGRVSFDNQGVGRKAAGDCHAEDFGRVYP